MLLNCFNLRKTLAILMVAALLLPIGCAQAAVPASKTKENAVISSPESICAKAGASDGKALIESMLDKVKSMKAYCFESVLQTYEDKKPTTETGKLYFKTPNLLRFEVIKAGMKSGAVVVRQPDGKIQGKMSWGPRMKLSPESKLLQTANGFSILESDLESLLVSVSERIKSNLKCLFVAKNGSHPEIIETIESDGDVVDRIVLDHNGKLPLEWCLFKGNKLFSVVRFVNLQTSQDLPDSLFSFGNESGGKTLEGDEYVATELKNLKNARGIQPLSVAAFREVDRTIAIIRQDLIDLQSAIPKDTSDSAPAEKSSWNDLTRAKFLSASIDIELLLTYLDPVAGALHNMGNEGEDIANAWSKDLDNSRKSLSRLIDLISASAPNYKDINETSTELQKCIERMQESANRGLSII